MKLISRTIRFIRINLILMRYNVDELFLGTHRFYPLRFFIYFNPYYWRTTKKGLTRGERVRLALESLGPIFVKAGQIVSTRRDLLPDDIACELSKLQDRVPSFSGAIATKIIEEALNCSVDEVFTDFDATALASASIAQVHAARLKATDEAVVIKVLRPQIKAIIDRDIDLLMTFAHLAERYWDPARHMKPVELVNEIAQTLYHELDLTREGANASQLKRNFADSNQLYIPKIYWEYCRANILVMERVKGIPIHDIDSLRANNVNLQRVAEISIELFFTQVFRDSFFHADLHPGNIFVCVDDPENPSLIAVDFGIVGSLNHSDQRYLAENMIAFFKKDYQRVAELHIACGWLPPDTRIDQFEGDIRAVSEPIFEQPLKDISFGKLLLRLFQVARRFHINIQPQLVLLQKTLLNVEGLSRQLAPDFDVWTQATPQIERWLNKQVGFKAFFKRVRENLPLWSDQLPELPTLVYEVLKETKHRHEVHRFKQLTQFKRKENHLKIRYFSLGVLLTLVVTGAVLFLYNI